MTVTFEQAVARYKKLPKEHQAICLQAFLYRIAEREKRVRFPKWAARLDAEWEETKRYARHVRTELERLREAREDRQRKKVARMLGVTQSGAR